MLNRLVAFMASLFSATKSPAPTTRPADILGIRTRRGGPWRRRLYILPALRGGYEVPDREFAFRDDAALLRAAEAKRARKALAWVEDMDRTAAGREGWARLGLVTL